MKWSKQKCKKVAFIVSFCYVLLGTFLSISVVPKYDIAEINYSSDIYYILFLFTYPVSIICIGVLYATFSFWAIIITFIILLLIIWFILYRVLLVIK